MLVDGEQMDRVNWFPTLLTRAAFHEFSASVFESGNVIFSNAPEASTPGKKMIFEFPKMNKTATSNYVIESSSMGCSK